MSSLYGRLWNKLLEPAYERLQGKSTPALQRRLARTQYLPPGELQDLQWRDLAALLRHAKATVPFFRDWFSESGADLDDILARRDLSALPIMNRGDIMSEPNRFRSQSPPQGSYAKATGGSSGEPLRFMVSPLSDQWRLAVTRRGYGFAGFANGEPAVFLWGVDLFSPGALTLRKRSLHRRLLRHTYINNFRLGEAELNEAQRVIDRCRPMCLVCFTSSAAALARHARKTGWRPASPLKSVIVGAEKLFPEDRELIESALGCPVFESYGSREFMLMAMECPSHDGLHVSAENLIIELVADGAPAQPGQPGEVLVTDLHNFAHPFIRYRTGDMAVWAQGDCPCGRTLPRLARIEGRMMDAIVKLDGSILTGGFFPHFFKDIKAIVKFQVEQDRRDHMTLRLVLSRDLTGEERGIILEKIGEVLPGMGVDIAAVDDIPKNKAGKVRVTIGWQG